MASAQEIASTHMTNIGESITALGTVVRDHGVEGILAPCLDRIQATLVQMDTRLNRMDTRLDRIDSRLDRLESSVDTLSWTQRNALIRRYNSAGLGGFQPLHKERPGGENDIGSLPSEDLFPSTETDFQRLTARKLLELEKFYNESFGEGSIPERRASFRCFITGQL